MKKSSAIVSVVLAVAAFLLSASRINHGLVDSWMLPGPGLTIDESINLAHGVYLADAVADQGPLLWTPDGAEEVFADAAYMADHPPLGRLVLGLAHQWFAWTIGGSDEALLNIPAARLGSCVALACTVLLLTEFTRRRYGLLTAVLAGLFLMLMPRVIGHARIASMEVTTTLMWLAVLVAMLTWWTDKSVPRLRQAAVTGVLWGLLMLTKMQGVLIPPLVTAWAFRQYGRKAVVPLVVVAVSGMVTFFIGWPWLWLDPVTNLTEYLARSADRQTLYVWYLHERFTDKLVPWHFPFVMTAVTVPLAAWCGIMGRFCGPRPDRTEQLLVASIIWPLCLFALPGVPVYDGTRLYLVIMPSLALLSARGVMMALQSQRTTVRVGMAITCGLLAIAAAWRTASPFALNDYNLACSGPTGAQRLGLEAGYWADGLNGDFWKQVPEGATVYVAPVSHQFQLSDIQQTVPVVIRRRINLQPFVYEANQQRGLLLTIHRLADLRPSLRSVPPGSAVIAEVKHHGVVLARLIDTTNATWDEVADW